MQLLLFETVHHVLEAERRLKAAGIGMEIVPTPKEHSSECGMSIRMADDALAAAAAVLEGLRHRVAGAR